MEKYAISVDWLQVYCVAPEGGLTLKEGDIVEGEYIFTLKPYDVSIPMFKEHWSVRYKGKQCANVSFNPRSPRLPERMVSIKLENRVLYHTGYIKLLYALMAAIRVRYKGITRIDLCYDCNRFAGGRSPSRFINHFIMKGSDKKGGLSRKGSEEFTCHGRKSEGSSAKINYIRFGSPNSKIVSYIYDKSIELREVKDKPWIRRLWQFNQIEDSEEKHVWRAEISISAEGTNILDMRDGVLFRLSPEYVENQEDIEELFYAYADRYLFFRENGGQKYKKNHKKVELFERSRFTTLKPHWISQALDSGVYERNIAKKLEELKHQYSDLSEDYIGGLEDSIQFLRDISELKNMRTSEARAAILIEKYKGNRGILEAYKNAIGNGSVESRIIEIIAKMERNKEYTISLQDWLDSDFRQA